MKKEDFIEAGFEYDANDPLFPFSYNLVAPDSDNDEDLDFRVYFGTTGTNRGFFIGMDGNFLHFHSESPKEALEWASKILNYDPNY